jgi:ATP-dependent DNA helicase RecG
VSNSSSSRLFELINFGESQTLEFKSSFDKACIESLVAFANAQGGSVLVGLSNAVHSLGVMIFVLSCA